MSNKPPFTPDKPAKTPGVVVGKKRPEQMSRARHLARLALQKQWKKLTKEQVGLDEGRESRSEYDANLAMAPVKKAATNASLPEINALMRKQKQKQHPKTKGFLQRLLNREEVQAESYEKAQQHKALAAKALETSDTSGYNKHMSDHHEEMGKWHESKGRSDLAQREFDKAEQSHEKFLSTTLKGNSKMKKEEVEQVEYIEEKLSKRDPASKWIHDFVASDNPKFAGKSKKMRINMALGAYYAAQRAAPKNEEVALDEKLDAVGRENADVNNDMKVDVTDKYLLARRAAIRNAIKSKKK
jgi:hypothetical protein